MHNLILLVMTAILLAPPAFGGSLWDKTKSVTKSTGEAIGDAAEKTVDAIDGEDQTPAQARTEIDQMAKSTLAKLFKDLKGAKAVYDNSVAYAVFDSRRMSFMITTEFGGGVAVDKKSGNRIYMKMATGGVNVGYGAQLLQFVFMFPSEQIFNEFITDGWDAGIDAGATAGEYSEGMGLELNNGTRVYELNEKGLALSTALTGTKYWKDDELN